MAAGYYYRKQARKYRQKRLCHPVVLNDYQNEVVMLIYYRCLSGIQTHTAGRHPGINGKLRSLSSMSFLNPFFCFKQQLSWLFWAH